jgi:hypothetical protein
VDSEEICGNGDV